MLGLSVFLKERLVARSTFEAREVRIGRSDDNDVLLENLGVSRYHAAIELAGGVHVLHDLGGHQGTWVNGERVQGRLGLKDGDRIAIGRFLLVYRSGLATSPAVAKGDPAAHARAGGTAELDAQHEPRERTGPQVAHLEVLHGENEPPLVLPVMKDLSLVGSAKGCDLVIEDADCPGRACVLARGYAGFTVLALAGTVRLNGAPLAGSALLASRDELVFGGARCRFLCAPRKGSP